jgi:hypothetical protein
MRSSDQLNFLLYVSERNSMHNGILRLVKITERYISDRSPLILASLAGAGVVATAVLTGKASIKASDILRAETEERTIREKIGLTWSLYVPAVSTGALTIACVTASTRIGTRRAAAMAAAYSLSEKAFVEYKDKVIEQIGKNKEEKVRDSIAADRVRKTPGSTEIILSAETRVLCFDSITGRYFESTMETLRKAQNDINFAILNNMYASLSDLYDLIGLPDTPYSREVGWNADVQLEMSFSTVLSEDGRPCISLDYRVYPIRGYSRLQ